MEPRLITSNYDVFNVNGIKYRARFKQNCLI